MIDFTGIKKLNIGGVDLKQLYIDGVQVWKSGYKNWVPYSLESGGASIYNGGLGYKEGYRVRSGGAEESYSSTCIGFIPVKGGDVVRISGWNFARADNGNAINVSNSSFTNIGQLTMHPAAYGILSKNTGTYKDYSHDSVVEEKTGVWKWVVPPSESGVAYIRVTGQKAAGTKVSGADMIVTINEEIA